MGIFNIGQIAGGFQIQKPSFWQKVKGELSVFEKSFNQYPPDIGGEKTPAIHYVASPVKKSKTTILLIGGGIACVLAIMFLK